MKAFKTFIVFTLAFIAFKANAQTDKATTERIVADKNYVFVATSATPLNSTDINKVLMKMPGSTGAGNISLTGDNYDVKVTRDSIVLYLPYYGRSYVAPVNQDDSGFKFTSKQFTYESTKTKRGGWNVIINSKDAKDNVRMNLSISKDGYASLNVTSNNRQSISYNGYLSEIEKSKSPSK